MVIASGTPGSAAKPGTCEDHVTATIIFFNCRVVPSGEERDSAPVQVPTPPFSRVRGAEG